MLVCPDCRQRLVHSSTAGDPQWSCLACRGRAISISTIERLGRPDVVLELRDAIRRRAGSRGIACPSCRRIARRVELHPEGLLVPLDVCRPCNLLWLDSGELEQLPRKARYTASQREDAAPSMEKFRQELAISRVRLEGELERSREFDVSFDRETLTLPGGVFVLFGLPVELDRPIVRRLPWLTWTLAVALVAMFFWGENHPKLARELSWIPVEPWRHLGLTAVSNFLLHADVWHLLSNLYFLVVFGDDVEDRFGRLRLLLVLAVSTILGNLLHARFDPRQGLPLVGASAGISGLLVWYVAAWPRQRIALSLWVRTGLVQVTWSAYLLFLVWIGSQLLLTAFQGSGPGRVSALAHLGGAIAGLLMWLAWRLSNRSGELAAELAA